MSNQATRATEVERETGTAPRSIALLFVDPHACVAEGLAALFGSAEDGINVSATSTSLAEVPKLVDRYDPDLLVLEFGSCTQSTLQMVARIRKQSPLLPIVLFAESERRDHFSLALQLGVRGVISKCSTFVDLSNALRLIESGAMILSPDLFSQPGEMLNEIDLNGSDRELLCCLARGGSNDEIARELAMSESTLRRRIRALLTKLQIENKAQAVVFATRHGLV